MRYATVREAMIKGVADYTAEVRTGRHPRPEHE
jgi:ketopantoate hydroxymethyltransferase